ncbi:MAG TPA: hypothetical protein VFH50_12985 [Acidimicrobiales bacterium]|nr:hypothetical protein [Acidimicrobiales bacterium]
MAEISTARALALLRQRLDELEGLPETTTNGSPEFKEWHERTGATLRRLEMDDARSKFSVVRWSPMVFGLGDDHTRAFQQSFRSGRGEAVAILKGAIFELEEFSDEPDQEAVQAAAVLTHDEQRRVEALVRQLRQLEEDGQLADDPEDRAEAVAEIETIEAQLRSPRPKRSIVRAALSSLGGIVHDALGAAAGAGMVVGIQEIVHLLGG